MATIEILSGDFERETTRIRYSDAGRAFLRLRSADGQLEDLFLESEVVGAAEAGDGGRDASRTGERDKRLFVVLLRGGRKFVARGDVDAMIQFECAAVPADLRREYAARLQPVPERRRPGVADWFRDGLIGRFLPGGSR